MSNKNARLQCPPGLKLDTSRAVYGMLSAFIDVPTHCHQAVVDDELKNPVPIKGKI